MWPGEVVEAFPFIEFCLEIDVAFVAEQLVEFLLIRSVRAFDLAVQLRRAAPDVGVSYALILDMPVELGLKLMAIVGSDLANAKREALDDVVDKVDGAGLGVFLVDLERSHPGRVIDGRELEATDLLSTFSFERQEFDIHLDMVAGNLLVVSLGVYLPQAGTTRKPVDAIALERP